VTTALAPALAEVSGLPGAPQRVTQIAATDTGGPAAMAISGSPPVLLFGLGAEASLPGSNGFQDGTTTTKDFEGILRVQFAQAFLGAGTAGDTPAQQAVEAALLQRAGTTLADQPRLEEIARLGPGPKLSATGPVYDAAKRLAAMAGTAWHAWLAANLTALRSGALTLEQLP
jgi:hypothetical protein